MRPYFNHWYVSSQSDVMSLFYADAERVFSEHIQLPRTILSLNLKFIFNASKIKI